MAVRLWIRWTLDDDGAGEAKVYHSKTGPDDKDALYSFDSLDRADQIPPDVAEAIKLDGRSEGEAHISRSS
jgi:hypothetical protein